MDNTIREKYEEHKSRDPYPEIPAALLNSAHIKKYADKIGLLDPFESDRRKSASYEIPFYGTVYIWDAKTKKKEASEITTQGKTFTVEPNSIAYIYLATTFYLPDYIAVRFNLKITQVHRGLLLGTGPLVDPGFCGRLLVPLHNLTSNSYRLVGGDGLIWVEFTKVSPTTDGVSGDYKAFPDRKSNLTPEQYFEKANQGNPIVSSIPDATLEARKIAEDARQDSSESKKSANEAAGKTEGIRRYIYKLGLGAVAGLLVTLTGLIYAGFQLTVAVNATVQNSVNYVKSQSSELAKRTDQISTDLGKRIDQLEQALEQERRAREDLAKKQAEP